MEIALLYLIVGLALLTWSSDKFIAGSVSIAQYFHVSPLLIGLTIVSLGTSAPEIMVSIMAALNDQEDLAIANVVGSNIANIGFVMGLTVLINPIEIKSKILRKEYPILAVITGVLVILFWDSYFARYEGVILAALLLGLIVWFYMQSKVKRDVLSKEFEEYEEKRLSLARSIIYFLIGVVLLPISANIVVIGASRIATVLGVSSVLIGLTIVALGTSLPEAAASIAATYQDEADIAVGNVVGSNMLNIVAVLPFVALISPGAIDRLIVVRDMPVMIAMTVVLWGLLYFGKYRLSRGHGILLLCCYIAYIAVLISGEISS